LIAPPVAAQVTPARITSGPAQPSNSSYRWVLVLAALLLAVLLGGGAVALFYQMTRSDSPPNEKTSTATPTTKPSESEPGKSNHPSPSPAPAKVLNLSGEWTMINTIERTSYPAYANLRVGYHLVITQTGNEFTADGEKVSENGRQMADDERTPIHLTGSVDQNSASANFVEQGLRRNTSGRFEWTVATDGNQLRGTFDSTAAKSSGPSVATREK